MCVKNPNTRTPSRPRNLPLAVIEIVHITITSLHTHLYANKNYLIDVTPHPPEDSVDTTKFKSWKIHCRDERQLSPRRWEIIRELSRKVSAAHCPAIVNVTCGFTDETVVRLQSDDAQVNNQSKAKKVTCRRYTIYILIHLLIVCLFFCSRCSWRHY